MRITDNGALLSGNRSDNLLKASLSHAKVVSSGTCTTTFTVSLGSMNDWHMIMFNVYSSSGITDIINPVASPKSPPFIIFPFSSKVK